MYTKDSEFFLEKQIDKLALVITAAIFMADGESDLSMKDSVENARALLKETKLQMGDF